MEIIAYIVVTAVALMCIVPLSKKNHSFISSAFL